MHTRCTLHWLDEKRNAVLTWVQGFDMSAGRGLHNKIVTGSPEEKLQEALLNLHAFSFSQSICPVATHFLLFLAGFLNYEHSWLNDKQIQVQPMSLKACR